MGERSADDWKPGRDPQRGSAATNDGATEASSSASGDASDSVSRPSAPRARTSPVQEALPDFHDVDFAMRSVTRRPSPPVTADGRLSQCRFIAVEGPIGVGKSSLARRLAEHLDARLIDERPDDNPFLERFYREPRHFALATQLHFLIQRLRQLKPLAQSQLFETSVHVADFLVDKDPLFAELNLEADEWELYREMYLQFATTMPRPDLVIYLQASVPVLQERIRKRDRRYEQGMDVGYLTRLNDAYTSFFYHYTGADLIVVNAERIDWVDNPADFAQLVAFLDEPQGGRRYFNPLPLDGGSAATLEGRA